MVLTKDKKVNLLKDNKKLEQEKIGLSLEATYEI